MWVFLPGELGRIQEQRMISRYQAEMLFFDGGCQNLAGKRVDAQTID